MSIYANTPHIAVSAVLYVAVHDIKDPKNCVECKSRPKLSI